MCDTLDQYGGIDSGDDTSVLFSGDECDDEASVVSLQRDYQVSFSWHDQVYGALNVVKEERSLFKPNFSILSFFP